MDMTDCSDVQAIGSDMALIMKDINK